MRFLTAALPNFHAPCGAEIKGSKVIASNESWHSVGRRIEAFDCVDSTREVAAVSSYEREPRLDTKQRCTTSTAHSKGAMIEPIALRDIRFGGALDALVGKDEIVHQQHAYRSKGTFRDWQLLLAQSQNKLLQKAFSEGGLDHQCRRKRNPLKHSRRSQMNELEYLLKRRAFLDNEKDLTDASSMELHLDEEYSQTTPSEKTKRSWLPATLLTQFSRETEDVPSSSCSSSPRQRRWSRKSWYERPESFKGMTVSDKPRMMQMVFFDGEQQSFSSLEKAYSGDEEKEDDEHLTRHKSLLSGSWSEDENIAINQVNETKLSPTQVDVTSHLHPSSKERVASMPSYQYDDNNSDAPPLSIKRRRTIRSNPSLERRDAGECVNSDSNGTRCESASLDSKTNNTVLVRRAVRRLLSFIRVHRTE